MVIGRSCRDVDATQALACIAGAMPLNDVSARDLQRASQLWTTGKAIDTFAPCGPALVTVDEIPDLQDLRISTRVNGVTVQDSSKGKMIFSVVDTIATGTPAGVSRAHGPATFLQAGDTVQVEIESLGVLENPIGPPHGARDA